MGEITPEAAAGRVPAGRWAVAVSGGADSVALLRLLGRRADLSLHVVHLDHQTRGEHSAADARFVAALAGALGIPCTVARREDVEAGLARAEPNASARFRAARLTLYRNVVRAEGLEGVVLAHHADDQAETVLQRLLRGSGFAGLAGMAERSTVGGVMLLRPLLEVRREALRRHLAAIGQAWREDASNASDQYLRNRLRRFLDERPSLTADLLELSERCRALRDWAREHAPALGERFPAAELGALPQVLARESARRWLAERGSPPEALSPAVVDRLIRMAADAASPPACDFPGGLSVRRRGGVMFVARETVAQAPPPVV